MNARLEERAEKIENDPDWIAYCESHSIPDLDIEYRTHGSGAISLSRAVKECARGRLVELGPLTCTIEICAPIKLKQLDWIVKVCGLKDAKIYDSKLEGYLYIDAWY
ncbi:MAG: hypothetical protein MPJ22_00430 [Pirellulales bacterium]|nr:hypothetical protein [Pirellulales bacterium]